MFIKLFVLIIFLISYFLIVISKKHPLPILYAGVAILVISPALNLLQAFQCINLNVIGVFWGTMILGYLFIYSNVPSLLASKLVSRAGTITGAMLAVCGLSAFISSYTENVATVLIVGPIALEVARKLDVNPVPFIIGVAISSNLQGCATMIGDSPSIILAMSSGMNFNNFFWMHGKPGIFFAVELGAIGSFLVLYLTFKKHRQRPQQMSLEPVTPHTKDFGVGVKTWLPTWMIIGLILSLILTSFIPTKPKYAIGIICTGWGIIGLVWHAYSRKETFSVVKGLDWKTFFFLIGIFILVGSLTQVGLITDLAHIMLNLTQANPLTAFLLLVIISVIASAFVDNIPYTMAMIPVAQIIAKDMGVSPYPYLFGLLIGACLGGNITPIGASCNIAGVGLLRKHGYKVNFGDFAKLGLPFTIAAVTLASLFIWLVWMK